MAAKIAPSVVLAVFAEPLVRGRRALVLGDATSPLARQLLDSGARLVQVYDASEDRVAEASARHGSRNINYAPWGEADLSLRDGAVEFAVIENLATLEDPKGAIKQLQRALSPRGAALVASPNPDASRKLLVDRSGSEVVTAIGYYDLYDLLIEQFEEVRMLGQTPFVGYALADFAPEDDSGISVDTSLVPGGAEEPEWFQALVSQHPVECEPFTIVQLALAEVGRIGQRAELESDLRSAQAAETALGRRVAELEEELRRRKNRPPPPAAPAQESPAQVAEAKRQKDWIAQLEARSQAADARADEMQAELEEQARRATEKEAEATRLKRQLDEQRQHATALEERYKKELEAAQVELKERDQRLSRLSEPDASDAAELAQLEQQLRGRGLEVQRLEGELKEARRVGTELIEELKSLKEGKQAEPDSVEELEQRLDALARVSARREADLIAANWTIDELRARLGVSAKRPENGQKASEIEQ